MTILCVTQSLPKAHLTYVTPESGKLEKRAAAEVWEEGQDESRRRCFKKITCSKLLRTLTRLPKSPRQPTKTPPERDGDDGRRRAVAVVDGQKGIGKGVENNVGRLVGDQQ